MNKNILRLKNISPLQKLIILQIDSNPEYIKSWWGGYNITCGELAKELGTTRTTLLKELNGLIDIGYITSVVDNRARITNFTDAFLRMPTKVN